MFWSPAVEVEREIVAVSSSVYFRLVVSQVFFVFGAPQRGGGGGDFLFAFFLAGSAKCEVESDRTVGSTS